MNAEEPLRPALGHLSCWSLIITVAVSTLSLIGWALGLTLLTSIKQGYIPIAPSSALYFLIVSATIVGFIIAKIVKSIGREIDQAHRERDEKVIALQKSEEKYRNLFNTIQDGLVLVDMQGYIFECNQAYADMLGYTPKEVTKLTYIQLTPEKWHDMEADIVNEKVIKTGYSDLYNKEYIRKDGTVFPINIRVWLIKDEQGSPKWMWAIARDITNRKRVEVALHRSEENFRRSLDDSPLGVRIVTVEGKTIYTNQAILDIYDHDNIEEFNSTPVENRYTPESYAEFQNRREKRKRGDYGPSEYEINIVRKDGEVRHLQVFRKEVLWDGERQFQVIYQDITGRKRVEAALQTSREQMRALAGRLQVVREEERTNIAREIHDELGGALTGLRIDFSLLTRAALKIENETVRTSLLAGMDSMTKFIDATIRTVRRIAMELRPGILDDLGLVAALEWQLKDFEKRTGIRCEFFPPVEDISLDADLSTAFFRIFQEALTNVARHSGAKEVRVRLRTDENYCTLEVEDNGKGIEKEKILSLMSLGLLGMRERALMLGGRLTVTGTPGRGTKVTVEILPSSARPLLAAW